MPKNRARSDAVQKFSWSVRTDIHRALTAFCVTALDIWPCQNAVTDTLSVDAYEMPGRCDLHVCLIHLFFGLEELETAEEDVQE
jgi:hypothetical protein